MATAVDVSDLIRCGHCRQIFTEPCQLPCGDILCRQCFMNQKQKDKKHPATDQLKSVRECPLCHQGFCAYGSELKPDSIMAMLVQRATGGKPHAVEPADTCSVPGCDKAAAGCGLEFEGRLCERHLQSDSEYFDTRMKFLTDQMKKRFLPLMEQIKSKKAALHDLISDRSDAADLFSDMIDMLQECRDSTLEKMDSAIGKLQEDASSSASIEALLTEINNAKESGRKKLLSQLSAKLQLALCEIHIDEQWPGPPDTTVERLERFYSNIKAAVDELSKASTSSDCARQILNNLVTQKVHLHDSYTPVPHAMFVCSNTRGFYIREGKISKICDSQSATLPSVLVVFGKNRSKDHCSAYFYTSGEPRHIAEWEVSHLSDLMSSYCSDKQQQFYLLLVNSNLVVTDLAGSVLHTVCLLQFEHPLRVTGCASKIFVLGSNSKLLCLSSETLEVQERSQLPVENVVDIAVVGRRLVVMNKESVYLMGLTCNNLNLLWSPDQPSQEPKTNLVRLVSLGFGFFLAYSDAKEWLMSVSTDVLATRTTLPFPSFAYLQQNLLCGHSMAIPKLSIVRIFLESNAVVSFRMHRKI